ncbi:MAG: protein kinase domain-containing protein [Candidatus Omnitrophota bacterium]
MDKQPYIPGYRILKKIGEGGTSTVYSAVHEKSKASVAIKVMDPDFLTEEDNLRRFARESTIGLKLKHKSIVKTFWMDRSGHYIVMELLEESLKDKLNRSRRLRENEALEIVKRIAGALDYAHAKGIVHRDIKPGNILFRKNGNPVLADFGLAVSPDLAMILKTQGKITGTLPYMSPEHCADHKCEPASDIFSLGAVMYELLTGKILYEVGSIGELVNKHLNLYPQLPIQYKRYQPLIDKMLAIDKKKRLDSGKKVIRMIDKLNGVGWLQKILRPAVLIPLIVGCLLGLSISFIIKSNNANPIILHQNENKIKEDRIKNINIFDPNKKMNIDTVKPPTDQPLKQNSPDENNNELEKPEKTKTATQKLNLNTDDYSPSPTTKVENKQPINSLPNPETPIYEIPTVKLNQLDQDVRENIENNLRKITLEMGGIARASGNCRAVITLNSNGMVQSVDIIGIDIDPKDKMNEFKSSIGKRIKQIQFFPPTINGKPVNVKIEKNFKNIRSISGKILLD